MGVNQTSVKTPKVLEARVLGNQQQWNFPMLWHAVCKPQQPRMELISPERPQPPDAAPDPRITFTLAIVTNSTTLALDHVVKN